MKAKSYLDFIQDQIQEKNVRDTEFIRYIVNFIIEQAKYNIVISEVRFNSSEFGYESLCYSYLMLFEYYIVRQKRLFEKT